MLIIIFSFIWNKTKVEIPEEWQLQQIEGNLVSIYEATDDDFDEADDHYVVLKIVNSGITRNVMSLDKSLLSRLSTETWVKAKISNNNNASELWELEYNDIQVVTLQETEELKSNLSKDERYMLGVFFIFGIFTVLFGGGLKVKH